MKLTLIGFGFVGKAVHHTLSKHHDVKIVDPSYNDNKIEDDSDAYIICVPTPSSRDTSCDMSIVKDVVTYCPENKPILIKSTISLEGWKNLQKFGKSLSFSPEFLVANNAINDFANQEFMLYGGPDSFFWKDIFPFPLVSATVEELIITKYVRNCFLATKVAFFNDIHKLCETVKVDYNNVANLTSMDRRIGSSHMQVPGPDGELGFGGACFPKDTKALVATGKHYDVELEILKDVIKANKKVRKE